MAKLVEVDSIPTTKPRLVPVDDPQDQNPDNMGTIGNVLMGGLKGATDIGATLLTPVDYALNKLGVTDMTNAQRRKALKDFYAEKADPESLAFKGGALGSQVAGTAGVGGVLGKAALAAGAAPEVAAALGSGGLSIGGGTGSAIGNAALRTAGGAVNGAATTGLVDPSSMLSGGVIGGALPGVVKVAGTAGNMISSGLQSGAQKLMQSAIKPTIKQLKSGDAATAVDTLLKYGINPNAAGVDKLRGLVDERNAQIADLIANSPATISKQSVLSRLGDVKNQFANQVSPTADLSAVDAVANDFANHPGLLGDAIPVQQAQDLKRGTYQVLAKKYGQMGSADTEAQKGLARGLKEEIAAAVPEVGPLNAQESDLIKTLNVTERRALMDLNKNPMGLAALANSPTSFAAFMADRSALFKSLAARMVKQASNGANNAGWLLGNVVSRPLVRSGLLSIEANP